MLEVLRKLAKKKAPPPICSAVIVAAGSARRMEGIDKVLAPLGELPVLVHTIYSFQDCPRFDEIVVVTREDLLVEVSRICKDFQLDKVSKVVVGGRERTDSVLAGLREVRPDADLIAIHDGARPLAPQQVLEEVVERAAETGAAAPAIPVTDTVKRAREGLIEETVDRSELWTVQTPQVFEAGLIRAAVEKAAVDGESLTDECGAVERLGMKVSLTAGSKENIKITTPFDLILGEAILEAGRARIRCPPADRGAQAHPGRGRDILGKGIAGPLRRGRTDPCGDGRASGSGRPWGHRHTFSRYRLRLRRGGQHKTAGESDRPAGPPGLEGGEYRRHHPGSTA